MNVTTVNIFRCDLRLANTPSLSHWAMTKKIILRYL